MSNYGFTNDQGEPMMDGAAYRFEQQLDADSAWDREYDSYMEDYYVDPAEDDRWDEDVTFDAVEDAAMEAGLFGWDC